jgi:CubicO group peptidase (beta-lactamase class C family)
MINDPSFLVSQSKRKTFLQIAIPLVLAALGLWFAHAPAGAEGVRTKAESTRPGPDLSEGLGDPAEFEAFLEPLVTELMTANHIPGGAIAVVKDGQLYFARGYGYADLESKRPATADSTIFRTGSISKVFTWTAVMQLAEQGKLDLNADVNTYLAHFQIPETFPQPITMAQLMTHTAGFEELRTNGNMFASADAYLPLQEFVGEKIPARIFPPGELVAYSNYGAALAGEIVAEISGEPFEQYIANHIFKQLEMNHSTFQQPLPSGFIQDAAVSYAVDENGTPHAGLFEYVQVQPAGALSATAKDMGNFMIAHLQDGQFGDTQVLQPESAQDMRRQYYAFNPQLPGVTRGFMESDRNNVHLFIHAGSTDLTSSLMALLPEQNVGIFMTFNSFISTQARLALLNALIDRYHPEPTSPAANLPASFAENDARFTGNYLASRRAETNQEKMVSLFYEVAVKSNTDGTLSVDAFRDPDGQPIRWVEIAPLVFQEAGGQSLLAFGTDAQDKVTAMFHGDQPILVFQKLAWYEDPKIQLAGLGAVLLVFLATAVVWATGALLGLARRKPDSRTRLERWGRYLAGGLILLNLVLVGFVVSVLVGDDSAMQFGIPTGFAVAGILALVSGVGTIALLVSTAGAWRQRAGGMLGRLHYTLVAVAALYFVWYLVEVNILQLPF